MLDPPSVIRFDPIILILGVGIIDLFAVREIVLAGAHIMRTWGQM